VLDAAVAAIVGAVQDGEAMPAPAGQHRGGSQAQDGDQGWRRPPVARGSGTAAR
jgi:hypothetical protein